MRRYGRRISWRKRTTKHDQRNMICEAKSWKQKKKAKENITDEKIKPTRY